LNAEVFKALSSIEGFSGLDSESTGITRLGGLTNRNYKIDCQHGTFVLRLAGEGTGDYIDREAELNNASIASEAGVNAEIVHFDTASGTMLCRYIDNAVTMDIEGLRNLDALRRTGQSFRQLHDCGRDFQGQFELFQQVDQYLAVLRELGAELPDGYSEVQKDAEQVRSALSMHPLPNKPCHCDPMVENCIDDGSKMYIIDFEYAGNNDPMWDLGDISVEGDFTAEQDHEFMSAYFGQAPNSFDVGRMVMYKAMCDLLWTLWGVVQHAHKNPADDFWAYSVGRLDRCRVLMASDDFPNQLEAVRRGPK
jgi:thiamine kinase-like enzyme